MCPPYLTLWVLGSSSANCLGPRLDLTDSIFVVFLRWISTYLCDGSISPHNYADCRYNNSPTERHRTPIITCCFFLLSDLDTDSKRCSGINSLEVCFWGPSGQTESTVWLLRRWNQSASPLRPALRVCSGPPWTLVLFYPNGSEHFDFVP